MTETSTEGEGGGYLPPLPKRVVAEGDDGLVAACREDPSAVIDEMLERANVLLDTLAHDEADLAEDREKARFEAEREHERRRDEAEAADAQLSAMLAEAEEAAGRKGRLDVLRVAMASSPPERSRPFEQVRQELEAELKGVKGITGAMRIEPIGLLLAEARQAVAGMEALAAKLREHLLHEADADLVAERKEAGASFEIGTMVLGRDLEVLERELPVCALPWSHPRWSEWAPPATPTRWTRLGTLERPGIDTPIPLLVDLDGPGVLLDPGPRRDEAPKVAASLLLRVMAALPPGGCRFTVVDTSGFGEVAGPVLDVAQREPSVMVGPVRTDAAGATEALEELAAHVQQVVHHYLRGRWASLAECRAAAGDLLEPQRILVLADHPCELDDRGQELLSVVVDHAERCGVTIVALRGDAAARGHSGQHAAHDAQAGIGSGFGFGFDQGWGSFGTGGAAASGAGGPGWGGGVGDDPLASLRRLRADDRGWHLSTEAAGEWDVVPDVAPIAAGSPAERVRAGAAEGAALAARQALSLSAALRLADRADPDTALDPQDPDTFWRGDTRTGIRLSLGRVGVVEPAEICLDSTTAGLLVAGSDDEEVSDALATIVDVATLRHSPDELRVQLLALGRRTFAEEADLALPHATFVGLEADPDGALAALDAVADEVELRQGRLRTAGAADVEALRADDEPMARLLVVVDDPAPLADGPGRLPARAASRLRGLVADGPAVGVHLVVALRQTGDARLASALSLEDPGARLALSGGQGILGRSAPTSWAPDRRGEALLVMGDAPAEAVVLASSAGRTGHLAALRARAGLGPSAPRPQVRDGGAEAVLEQAPLSDLVASVEAQRARLKPRLWLGEPSGLGGPVEVLMRREDGANLLVVSDDELIGHGVLLASMVTALLVHGTHIQVTVLDLTGLEEGFGESCRALAEHLPVEVQRRRRMPKVLDGVRRLVADRREAGRYGDPPALLVVAGLARARDLDVRARTDPADPAAACGADLEVILRDGPEVGVHTIIWSERVEALDRRLGPAGLRELGLRVASRLDEDASELVVESSAAVGLGPRQAVLYDEDRGRLQRFRPYAPPDASWLEGLTRAAMGEI